jgi:hypothetical protein
LFGLQQPVPHSTAGGVQAQWSPAQCVTPVQQSLPQRWPLTPPAHFCKQIFPPEQ